MKKIFIDIIFLQNAEYILIYLSILKIFKVFLKENSVRAID